MSLDRPVVLRRGVTLIELMVVLGIMLALGTIGVSAFARTNKVSRQTATRDLVADQVRQARATARASGRPVLLRISQVTRGADVVGGEVIGAVQSPVFIRDFETPLFDTTTPVDQQFRTRLGTAGQGFVVPKNGAEQPAHDTPTDDEGVWERRSWIRPKDGFLVQVSVRLETPKVGDVRTLVLLHPDDVTDRESGEAAVAGLRLIGTQVSVFPKKTSTGTDGPPKVIQDSTTDVPWDPAQQVWMLQGWLRLSDGTRVLVSELASLDAAEPDEVRVEPVPSSLNSPADPHVIDALSRDLARLTLLDHGGVAVYRLGLLWDGQRLTLLRNGHPMIRSVAKTGVTITKPIACASFGRGLYPQKWDPASASRQGDWPAITTVARLDPAEVLDEVILDRQSSQAAHPLPSGVVPKQSATVYLWPDGSATALPERGAAAANPVVLEFHGAVEDADAMTTVTIAPTSGAVTATSVAAGAAP